MSFLDLLFDQTDSPVYEHPTNVDSVVIFKYNSDKKFTPLYAKVGFARRAPGIRA